MAEEERFLLGFFLEGMSFLVGGELVFFAVVAEVLTLLAACGGSFGLKLAAKILCRSSISFSFADDMVGYKQAAVTKSR